MKALPRISSYALAMLALGLVAYALWPIINDTAPDRCMAMDNTGLRAQSVYTNLRDPGHIQIFTEVSDGIICQCGCNFILSVCPHQECPWGIPARRFIENRILEGMSAAEILAKLENGFGESARKDPIMIGLIASGQTQLVDEFVHGYGPSISALSSGFLIPIALIAIVLGAWLGYIWWKRNKRQSTETRKTKTNQKEMTAETDDPFADLDR